MYLSVVRHVYALILSKLEKSDPNLQLQNHELESKSIVKSDSSFLPCRIDTLALCLSTMPEGMQTHLRILRLSNESFSV